MVASWRLTSHAMVSQLKSVIQIFIAFLHIIADTWTFKRDSSVFYEGLKLLQNPKCVGVWLQRIFNLYKVGHFLDGTSHAKIENPLYRFVLKVNITNVRTPCVAECSMSH